MIWSAGSLEKSSSPGVAGKRFTLTRLQIAGVSRLSIPADLLSTFEAAAAPCLDVHNLDSIKCDANPMLDLGKDIRSLSDFKRNTSNLLKQMRDSGRPVILTRNGKAAIVVQDADSYQRILDQLDQLQALDGIKRGLADVKAGRVTSVKDFEKEFRKRHGIPSRSRRFREG
jgi:prevent-host-death family protein